MARLSEAARRGEAVARDLSRANVRDFGRKDIDDLREFMNADLFAFAWVVFEYSTLLVPEVHGPICDFVGRWGSEGNRRLMVQVPRDIGKTSLVTRANALWQICRNPNHTVAIFNEKEANSVKWLRGVREVVERSKVFQTVYADLLPPGLKEGSVAKRWKWSDTELQFQRTRIVPEASITALGVTAATTGGHWTHVIKDDILSFDAARSPVVMQMVRDWVDAARNLESPAQKGCDLFVCTPWGYDDAYSYVLGKWGEEYQLYRRGALENGESIIPSKWTTAELLRMQSLDPYNFAAQYLCRPMAGRDVSFQQEWFRYSRVVGDQIVIEEGSYDPACREVELEEPAPQRVNLGECHLCLLVDPAPTEQTDMRKEPGSRSALVMVAMDPWGRKHVLDLWVDRKDPLEVIHRMLSMLKEWQCDTAAIEKVVFSVLYRHWLQQEADRLGLYVRVLDLEPARRSKDTRINALIPPFKRGMVYLNRGATQMKEMVQELLEYPYGRTRDLLDALAYGDDVLRRPETPEEMHHRLVDGSRRSWPYSSRDNVTGY